MHLMVYCCYLFYRSKEKFQKPNEELQSYYAGKKTRYSNVAFLRPHSLDFHYKALTVFIL